MQKTRAREYTIPYVPHPKQIPFHQDRYTWRFRLLRGGTGSGKTIAGVFEMLSWLLGNPGCVGYIFEPTYKMVTRILIRALNELLGFPFFNNPIIRDYNKGEHRIDLVNTSQLWFGGLEDPEMAEGPNVDIIMLDEGRLVRHFDTAWKVIQRRIRGSIPGKYPTGAYVTTTPDAPGSPMHQFFEDPKTKNPNAKVYNMTLFDNPYLTAEYIADIKRSHHGGLAERFIFGRFAAVGAGTIPFDYSFHVITPSQFNKNIIIQWVYGIDFGWTNPSCVLAIGFDKDGRAYVVDEFYEPRVTEDRVLAEGQAMEKRWGRGCFYCDPTQQQTIQWLCANGLDAVKNEPKRDEGIRHMAGYFPKAGDGRPRIQILNTCVNLIAELQVYNETVKEFDHAVDTLRYGLGSQMKKEGDVDAWILG